MFLVKNETRQRGGDLDDRRHRRPASWRLDTAERPVLDVGNLAPLASPKVVLKAADQDDVASILHIYKTVRRRAFRRADQ